MKTPFNETELEAYLDEALPAEARAGLGAAGRARVRAMFEAERVADQWERLYLNLFNASGGTPHRRAASNVPALLGDGPALLPAR